MKEPMYVFQQKYGSWALITGAFSGIGEEFAKQLATLNFNLVLVARRKEKLEELSQNLKAKHKISVKVVVLDLSKSNFINDIMEATRDMEIGLVVNNAGFALTGGFLEQRIEDKLALINVNCNAPLILSHYFGSRMVKKGKGGIINVASATAFLPLPNWTNYAASKAYLLSLSEGLWYEFKEKGVDILTLCPGATKTNFAEVAGVKSSGMEASEVVKTGLQNLGKKPTVIVGINNKIITFFLKFFSRKTLIKMGAKAVSSMTIEENKS